MNPLEARPENIWNYRQNKPSYVCRDLEALAGVPQGLTARILVARGVTKWLAVRRRLIVLKNAWKEQIRTLHGQQAKAKRDRDFYYRKGYLAALEQCRAEVRELCHSERWAWPDHDRGFARLLAKGDGEAT
jgi:hypothetical protein